MEVVVSEMTYTVSSGTLNSSIPYHTMEVVVTTGAIRRAMLQSNCHHQQTHVLQAGCPSCHPTNSVRALNTKYHISRTCSPQACLGFSKFVFDH